jgi:hypothetical protein
MQRFILQAMTAFGGLVLLAIGLCGVLLGVQFLHGAGTVPVDNHFRFMSGVIAGVGFAFLCSLRHIERHRDRFAVLSFAIFIGGLAHLYSVLLHGVPSIGTMFGLFMELIYTPLLWLLHRHVANRAARNDAR